MSGADYDFIRVCVNDNPDCCREIEFMPPNCDEQVDECELGELEVGVGAYTSDSTYVIELDFEVENVGNDFFDLFVRGGELFDFYRLNELPLRLEDFEMSGADYDFIRVCVNDNPDCCREIEFMPPGCTMGGDCEIETTIIETGMCTSDSTYVLELDFEVQNPGNTFYELWIRNDVYLGFYILDELPMRFDDFPLSGRNNDFLRICINDMPDCCIEVEWLPPGC